MKKTLKALVILIGTAATGNAGAAELNSLAYIDQVGSRSYSRLDTAAIFAPLIEVAQSMPRVTSGESNLALVWQDGDFNTASIDQSGGRNVGLIRQIGYHNAASIQQTGSGHQALIFQQGRNNTAIINQR